MTSELLSLRRLARRAVPLVLGTTLAGGAAVAVLTMFTPKHRPLSPHTESLPEVTRAALILREGRLHLTNATAPFTGWLLERYADGLVRSRSMLSNGVLHGPSEGWSSTGLLEIRESYVDGQCHGLRTRWYTNGVVKSQTTFVSGQPEGVSRRWHPNGRLAEQVRFRAGQEDGISLALYPSGHLKAEASVAHGKLVENRSWPDGMMAAAPELASAAPLPP